MVRGEVLRVVKQFKGSLRAPPVVITIEWVPVVHEEVSLDLEVVLLVLRMFKGS